VTTDDENEMFALLFVTIEQQAREGYFSDIGTIENMELTSTISNSTQPDGDANIAKTAGIPIGVVGGTLVVLAAGIAAYCIMYGGCCMRGDTDGDDQQNHNKDTTDMAPHGDVIVAEAIVIENDEGGEYKKSKSRFL
jgi:hypothetical protein